MKRIIAVLLIACLCFGIAACSANESKHTSTESDNNSPTTESTQTVVETGLTIAALKQFAIGNIEDYAEVPAEDGTVAFSFTTNLEKWRGKLSGENVLTFTIEIEEVTATTKDEFLMLAYYGYKDFGKLSLVQVPSAFSIMYIMDGFVMLGGSGETTMDDAAGVLLNGETLTTGNWSLSATFDDSADNVKITGIYQE